MSDLYSARPPPPVLPTRGVLSLRSSSRSSREKHSGDAGRPHPPPAHVSFGGKDLWGGFLVSASAARVVAFYILCSRKEHGV